MDAKINVLQISISPLSKDVLDVFIHILQWNLQFSSFTLSGVSVNTVHYAGSNNPQIEQKYIERQKLCAILLLKSLQID
jgi:hypothetical protein